MTYQAFGGDWTEQKLQILERYLGAYTTALKDQPFQLVYVDAFAGYGSYQAGGGYDPEDYSDFRELHDGSPKIALAVQDKPFDQLVFIDKDPERCESLEQLRRESPERNIEIRNEDANDALPDICDTLKLRPYDRAVVFLDPFATQVAWSTVAALADTKKTDCWILFPLMAITRLMPLNNEPQSSLADRLDRVFGGREYWQSLYHASPQLSMFTDEPAQQRLRGSDHIANRYRERLASVFSRVAPTRRTLTNSKNSPMFDLFFAASNPKGAGIAVGIADHILQNW